jgi:hypothetical protein
MRATLTVLLLSALTACRISGLGNCSRDADCSAGAACDPAQRVCVPTDAPAFSNIAVSTPADYTDPNGRAFFDTAGPPLSVSATITGRAGVDPATVCLRVAGESGACLHPGTAGSGNTFTFPLPRPSGSFDGTTPLDFTIAAASPTGRASTSAVQHVYFDNQPPAIAVAADPTPYARSLLDGGAAPIAVSVTITDPTGVVSPQLLSGSKTLEPAGVSGSVYTFQLDPADAPAEMEGPYTFNVRATDGLGHQSIVAATRTIDGAPPTLAVIKIYNSDAGEPDAGVTYPPPLANTGWTGSTFIYNDVVHVKGSITDVSGIASASLRINGIDLDGGVAMGAARPLGCTTSTTCAFDLVLALNDPQNGAFHTGTSTFDAGAFVGAVPAGMLQIAIDAQDNAVAYGGTPAAHQGPTSMTPARTTRLLWLMPLGFAAVSGLAVHPSGDVIVALDGGTVTIDGGNAVYDLAPDQPRTRWGVTLSASAPAVMADGVNGPPAIGAGDATSARIYVASAFGDLYAFTPDGSVAWTNVTSASLFAVGPSITPANTSGGTVDEMIVPDGVGGGSSQLWRATSGTDVTSVASADRDFHAAPLILDGGVYFATQSTSNGGMTHLTRHPLASDGGLDAGVIDSANPGVPYFGLVTDGKNLYAATRPAAHGGILVGVDSSLKILPSWDGGVVLTDGLAGEPTFGIDGKLYGANLANQVFAFDAGTGAATPFVTLTGVGMTPLQGSDGHVYFPRRPFSVDAYDGNLLSWTFQSPGPILRYGIMDCAGRLFVASGATVYAFLTDDHGLADTPWPSLRRDARNTGNAAAPKYGIRTPPNTCDQ